MAGIKPKRRVHIKWSPEFAYAIGLLATDGCLLNDGRHIDITSKDVEQLKNVLLCLGIKNKIGKKSSGYGRDKKYPRIQFGDVVFYKFLLGIGLTPAKSKTIGALAIPDKYFFDFLRGSFDGDGCFYSYYDPRWKASFMFYVVFNSASKKHIDWLRGVLYRKLKVKGHITNDGRSTFMLRYAKRESLRILRKMYHDSKAVCLKRKNLKIKRALAIVNLAL